MRQILHYLQADNEITAVSWMVTENMKLLVQKESTTIHSNHHTQNNSILSAVVITQFLL